MCIRDSPHSLPTYAGLHGTYGFGIFTVSPVPSTRPSWTTLADDQSLLTASGTSEFLLSLVEVEASSLGVFAPMKT